MANIDFPQVAPSSYSHELITPNQAVHDSPLTGDTEVYGTGIAYWQGSITWGPFGQARERPEYRDITSFMSSLGGADHTFDIPWPEVLDNEQDNRFAGDVTLTDWTRASTRAELQLSTGTDITTNTGLRKGDWITIDNRLYQCVSHQQGVLVIVTPGKITAAVGDAVEYKAPTIRARSMEQQTPTLTYDRDFMEKVRLEWRQADV